MRPRKHADEPDDIASRSMSREEVLRDEIDHLAARADRDVCLERKPPRDFPTQSLAREGLPDDEDARGANVDRAEVPQLRGETRRSKRAVAADIHATEENHQRHEIIPAKSVGTSYRLATNPLGYGRASGGRESTLTLLCGQHENAGRTIAEVMQRCCHAADYFTDPAEASRRRGCAGIPLSRRRAGPWSSVPSSTRPVAVISTRRRKWIRCC